MTNHTSFRLPCVRRLEINLGKVDSTVECTELAIRELIANSLDNETPAKFIQKLSDKHGVKVDNVNLHFLQVHAAQLYVIAVYQQAEDFLESFRDEHPLSREWTYGQGNDLLERILKNVSPSYQDSRKSVGTLEIDLLDHYRLVRNRFVHPEIDETRIDRKVPELQQQVRQKSKYSRLNAPNLYSEISFDDFILFTRALKHIAHTLCTVSRPTDEEIADAAAEIIRTAENGVRFQKLKRLSNNSKRVNNALTTFLRDLYGLNDNEIKAVVQRLQKDLLA